MSLDTDDILDLEERSEEQSDRFRLTRPAAILAFPPGVAVIGLVFNIFEIDWLYLVTIVGFLASLREGRYVVVPFGLLTGFPLLSDFLPPDVIPLVLALTMIGMGVSMWYFWVRSDPHVSKWLITIGIVLLFSNRLTLELDVFWQLDQVGLVLMIVGYIMRFVLKVNRKQEDIHKLVIVCVYCGGFLLIRWLRFDFEIMLIAFCLVFYTWVLGYLTGFYPQPGDRSVLGLKDE